MFITGACQLLQVNLCGNYLPVSLGSDNAGSMEGKDKHEQVGTSTKEFIYFLINKFLC